MNTVEPIKSKDTVNMILGYLKERNMRDCVMFAVGIYSGLRISDILKLTVKDVKSKERISMREMKTGKERKFPISSELKRIIDPYVSEMKEWEYLFKSRKGNNKPITRQRAYGILREVGDVFGIESMGTHTLRKTFGYFLYQQCKDIVIVKEILNHSSIEVTRRYIGLVQDDKDIEMKKLSYK